MNKPSITLASLSIRIFDSSSPNLKSKIKLNDFGDGLDLLPICNEILSPLVKKPTAMTTLGDICQIAQMHEEGRYLKGIFETGRTGSEQDILNINSPDPSYHMTTDDALMMPHYFCIYLPEGKDVGIIFLQRFKQSGIQGLFLDFLNRQFKKQNNPFELKTDYLTNTNSLNKMIEDSGVKEVRLTQREWSSDRADNESKGATDKLGTLVVTLKPTYNGIKNIGSKLMSAASGKLEANKIVELPFIEPDEVSFLIKKGKRDHRISFEDNQTNFRPYLDVTNDVVFEKGHPTFYSIDLAATELMQDLSKDIYESPGSKN